MAHHILDAAKPKILTGNILYPKFNINAMTTNKTRLAEEILDILENIDSQLHWIESEIEENREYMDEIAAYINSSAFQTDDPKTVDKKIRGIAQYMQLPSVSNGTVTWFNNYVDMLKRQTMAHDKINRS